MAVAVTYIQRILDRIRLFADEPAVGEKYTDAELIQEMDSATQEIIADLNTSSDAPLIVRHTITPAVGTNVFMLPPNVEAITRIAKLNATTGIPEWVLEPSSKWSFFGPGISLEGRILRFTPPWSSETASLEVQYIPNGDLKVHSGTTAEPFPNRITMDTVPDLGTLDKRENAYVGAVVRVYSHSAGGTVIQERTITGYNSDLELFIEPNWNPSPTGAVLYEIIPMYHRLLEKIIALHVAQQLRGIAGDERKDKLLEKQYLKARRALRMQLGRMQGIVSDRFEHDTAQSETYASWR